MKNSLRIHSKQDRKFTKTYSVAAVLLWQQRSKSSTRQALSAVVLRTLDPPSKKSFKSSRFSITEKTSLKKELVEENKKIIYIFLILWPSLGWSSLALLHLVALEWSSSSLKKSSFFWQEIWILCQKTKMENRNTRLGGVNRRRALGDLTSQLNNRPTNFQNQDTLQPIKPQVRIFGSLTFWICGRFLSYFWHTYCGPLTIVTEKFFLLLMLSAFLFNRKGGQWTDSMGHFSSDLT